MGTATLEKRTRASPIFYFPHTQDFLRAIKEGKINTKNLHLLPHPLLREIARAMLDAKKDNFVYHGENYEFALNLIPTPEILPAPLPENLPDFAHLPEYLDTTKCRFCGKEIVVIKMTKIAPNGKIGLSFLTIECGKIKVAEFTTKKLILQ
ncbi:MAG: hypothetical protein LR000_01900 [Candidatus Pacebacteria bacterium]|nr:hypothetical protein [Candidatus Paceibacterota bacterium]